MEKSNILDRFRELFRNKEKIEKKMIELTPINKTRGYSGLDKALYNFYVGIHNFMVRRINGLEVKYTKKAISLLPIEQSRPVDQKLSDADCNTKCGTKKFYSKNAFPDIDHIGPTDTRKPYKRGKIKLDKPI